jgi:AraC-like DNA-binding protein
MALESLTLPAQMRSPAALTASYLRELLPSSLSDKQLRDSGIDSLRLHHDSHYRIPLHQAYALLETYIAAAEDALIGIRHAHALSLRAFPWLGMGLLASTTLAEGLNRLIELDPLIWDGIEIELRLPQEPSAEVALIMTPHLPMPPAVIELALAGWVLLGPALWQIQDHGHRVSFQHAARATEADYQGIFGCPVSFQAEATAVYFPSTWLNQELRFADPSAGGMILKEARRLLAEPILLNLENELRAACFRAMPGPLPDTLALATALGLSARQLRQSMSERQLNLRNIQDATRREAALYWLGQANTVLTDVALACGFSEQSAFQRAFRRWTGLTPGQWLQQSQTS